MSSRSSGMCGLHATESPLRHYSGLPNKSSTNTNEQMHCPKPLRGENAPCGLCLCLATITLRLNVDKEYVYSYSSVKIDIGDL